jgi:hypothetical protein
MTPDATHLSHGGHTVHDARKAPVDWIASSLISLSELALMVKENSPSFLQM